MVWAFRGLLPEGWGRGKSHWNTPPPRTLLQPVGGPDPRHPRTSYQPVGSPDPPRLSVPAGWEVGELGSACKCPIVR
eukprot:890452-Prorocentrum_minimum.AAC.1